MYFVKLLWSDHSEEWEPMAMLIGQDRVTMAVYAKEYGLLLLDTPMRNEKEAFGLMKATETVMEQLFEYEYKYFRDLGRHQVVPHGYQQIPLRMVLYIGQSLKRKA